MKCGVISDLHIDGNRNTVPEESSFVEILAAKMEKEALDVLLLAGDVSNDYREGINFLEELQNRSSAKVLFVPGNHDYWSKENNVTDTWKIYRAFQKWEGCISEKPYLLNKDWVVIGNSGWYDHSFGSPDFSEAEFKKMNYMDRTWQDSIYTNWGRENAAVHRYFYEKIEAELREYAGKNIIMMTHMLTHPYFTVPMPNELWAYFNAFLGSKEYSNLFEKYPICYSIMGHVHYRKYYRTDNTAMICACLGNHNEWRTKDLAKEIDDAMFCFSID
ncbi:metallophosphoesterase [Bacillaceae bacterium Marseille-Q3522]|nr:metallophosphoesterase [Bacillaceae bacterium Marseille-Q3522]